MNVIRYTRFSSELITRTVGYKRDTMYRPLVVRGAKGDWRAGAFMLERKYKKDWGSHEQIDATVVSAGGRHRAATEANMGRRDLRAEADTRGCR